MSRVASLAAMGTAGALGWSVAVIMAQALESSASEFWSAGSAILASASPPVAPGWISLLSVELGIIGSSYLDILCGASEKTAGQEAISIGPEMSICRTRMHFGL